MNYLKAFIRNVGIPMVISIFIVGAVLFFLKDELKNEIGKTKIETTK